MTCNKYESSSFNIIADSTHTDGCPKFDFGGKASRGGFESTSTFKHHASSYLVPANSGSFDYYKTSM